MLYNGSDVGSECIMEKKLKFCINKGVVATAFFSFFILIVVRGAWLPLSQTFYAEDGIWWAKLQHSGFFDTALNARQYSDYPVFINVCALAFGDFIRFALFSGDHHFAVISVWLAVCVLTAAMYSMAGYWLTRLHQCNGCVVVGISLLVPCGGSDYEIFGTVANLGFHVLVPSVICGIAFCIMELRSTARLLVGFFLLLAVLSSPAVCFVYICISAVVFFVNLTARVKGLGGSKRVVAWKCMLFVASIAVLIRSLLMRQGHNGPLFGPFSPDGVAEAFFARPYFYPFAPVLYGKLTDSFVYSIALIIFTGFLFASYNVMRCLRDRCVYVIYLLVFAAFSATLGTVFSRKGLTTLLNGYQNSFPDRYFMAFNELSFIIVVGSAMVFISRKWPNRSGLVLTACVITLMLIYPLGHLLATFRGSHPATDVRPFSEFIDGSPVRQSSLIIPINPPGWNIELRSDVVSKLHSVVGKKLQSYRPKLIAILLGVKSSVGFSAVKRGSGFVDEVVIGREVLTLRGWSAQVPSASVIAVFFDEYNKLDRPIHVERVPRPDVVKALSDPGLYWSGYKIEIPIAFLGFEPQELALKSYCISFFGEDGIATLGTVRLEVNQKL